MTMSKDLYLAILSMDAYNRGYNPGIDGLGDAGHIGNATVLTRADIGISDPQYQAWQDASFYAVSYTMGANSTTGIANGTSITSYRLGDALSGSP